MALGIFFGGREKAMVNATGLHGVIDCVTHFRSETAMHQSIQTVNAVTKVSGSVWASAGAGSLATDAVQKASTQPAFIMGLPAEHLQYILTAVSIVGGTLMAVFVLLGIVIRIKQLMGKDEKGV